MCEVSAYIETSEGQELIMDNVSLIDIEDGKIHLKNLWGELKEFSGNIKQIDLTKNKVILQEKAEF
ncbi:MAG: CooT family nickel-binding protein [Candidatus Omnitrophota bacterium]